MNQQKIFEFAANGIAANILRNIEKGSLTVSPQGSVRFPLVQRGLNSVSFAEGIPSVGYPPFFGMRCPICWSGWLDPVAKKGFVSFLRDIFSERRGRKIVGLTCTSKHCRLYHQTVPWGMITAIVNSKQVTVGSSLLALLEDADRRGSIDEKKEVIRLASELSIGTQHQGLMQSISTKAEQITPPVSNEQWQLLDELIESAALSITDTAQL